MLVKKLMAGPTRIELNKFILDGIVSASIGESIESTCRASESYTNEVYRIRTESGASYYVKFFDDEFHSSRAKAELSVMEDARKLGIPVPDVVYTDFSRSKFKRDFAILKEVSGKELRHQKITPETADLCIKMLSQLHNRKRDEYGFLYLPTEHWERAGCYFDFLSDVIVYGIRKLEKKGQPVRGLHDAYSAHREKIQDGRYCFNHNDFTTKHIFTNGQAVTGLIDWEWSAFLNPISDYAVFLNSLLDEGVSKQVIGCVMDLMKRNLDNFEDIDFYMGRQFLLGAMFPHKNRLASHFTSRKLLFGKLLLQGEFTFDDFVRDFYEKTTFAY